MPTLTVLRQAVSPRLGPFIEGTSTSGSSESVLEMTGWPFKSTISQDDLFAGQTIFRPSAAAAADKTRIVDPEGGYTPATGKFTPDQVWTNSPGTETIEVHGHPVPVVSDGINDLHALINEALKKMLVVVEFTFTVSSNTAQRHSMASSASWLDNPGNVLQVGMLATGESRSDTDPFNRVMRGRATKTDGIVYLNDFGATTSDTMYVLALKPAYDHCKATAGSYGGQAGLSLETDEAIPQKEWVVAQTMVEVWDRLGTILAPGNQDRVQLQQAEAASEADYWKSVYLEQNQPDRTFEAVRQWGPVP